MRHLVTGSGNPAALVKLKILSMPPPHALRKVKNQFLLSAETLNGLRFQRILLTENNTVFLLDKELLKSGVLGRDSIV